MEYTIVDLYRNIGILFRKHGAEHVALLSSKNNINAACEMTIEVAADGMIDVKYLYQQCQLHWPQINIIIYDLNKPENHHLIDEINEGGILL